MNEEKTQYWSEYNWVYSSRARAEKACEYGENREVFHMIKSEYFVGTREEYLKFIWENI